MASSAPNTLQWGRGLWTAESLPRLRSDAKRRDGFNGAAVFGPRREKSGAEPPAKPFCFNGAAVFGPRRGGTLLGLT